MSHAAGWASAEVAPLVRTGRLFWAPPWMLSLRPRPFRSVARSRAPSRFGARARACDIAVWGHARKMSGESAGFTLR